MNTEQTIKNGLPVEAIKKDIIRGLTGTLDRETMKWLIRNLTDILNRHNITPVDRQYISTQLRDRVKKNREMLKKEYMIDVLDENNRDLLDLAEFVEHPVWYKQE